MKQFFPIGGRVIIKPTKQDITSGGVIVPETNDEGVNTAEVVAVGPGLLLLSGARGDMQCIVGDIVLYTKLSAKVMEDTDGLMAVQESDLLSIINRTGPKNKSSSDYPSPPPMPPTDRNSAHI